MPWRAYAGLTKSDVRAIVEYLSSLPAISHKVPGPFGLDEKPAIFRMTIAAGKGGPARLRKATQGAGRLRKAGDPPKGGLDCSSEILRTDRRGARNEELWSQCR